MSLCIYRQLFPDFRKHFSVPEGFPVSKGRVLPNITIYAHFEKYAYSLNSSASCGRIGGKVLGERFSGS